MAEIKPFRAWRYNRDLTPQLGELTSPLFDVVSEKQRNALYKNPHNSIHLSVPRTTHAEVGKLLNRWKYEQILEQDDLPTIYVYYQHFSLPGSPQEFVRKGFVCHIRAYEWEEKMILRHENTMPGSVGDRFELLQKTRFMVSPTHGLYTDEALQLEPYMDESMAFPLYETEDYQGVREVLSVIHDAEAIRLFLRVLREKTVILADGHHRYEASLAYRKHEMARNPQHNGQEAYNYHLMYLTNTEANDLRILPTHRLITGLLPLDSETLAAMLSAYFVVRELEDPCDLEALIHGKKWTFGLLMPDRTYKLQLKPEVHAQLDWKFPEEVKELDLTVLHYFVLEKVLGIPGKEHRTTPHLRYSRSFAECLALVTRGEAQCALITHEVTLNDVKRVCASGAVMPPKSTYFYPKVLCGLAFSSLIPNEFDSPFDFGF